MSLHKPTFQQVILTLQQFWGDRGCVLLQPYDLEVGAGTSHTATFLRAIGPEPWNAAYVQPSRRPKDGRYGENPNRLQHYYQFQVVLKPSPLNIQELYLDSLRALGIDPWQSGIGSLVAINLVFTFLVPNISIGGHLGGLLGGAAHDGKRHTDGARHGRLHHRHAGVLQSGKHTAQA